MRGLAAITTCVVLAAGVLGLSGQAQAASITHPDGFFGVGGGEAQLKLTNFESAFSTGWSANTDNWGAPVQNIQAGQTYLRGIFRITTSSNLAGSTASERTPSGFELTGVFSALVNRVVGTSDPTKALFELVPDSAFETAFGNGAMAAFFHDTTPDFDAEGTLASTVAKASDGSLYMTLGAPGSEVWGTDYYWGAIGSATPGVSTFASSLALLTNNTGFPSLLFKNLTQQQPIHSEGTFTNEAALDSILNEFGLQGNTSVNTVGTIPWQLKSEDPVRAHVVPLPAASSLGAAMLLGLLGLGFRRSRRRAA